MQQPKVGWNRAVRMATRYGYKNYISQTHSIYFSS